MVNFTHSRLMQACYSSLLCCLHNPLSPACGREAQTSNNDDRLHAMQSQGGMRPDLLQQATNSLEVLKASIQTQLSHVLPGASSPPAVDLSQFQSFLFTTLTNVQNQRELLLSSSRNSQVTAIHLPYHCLCRLLESSVVLCFITMHHYCRLSFLALAT